MNRVHDEIWHGYPSVPHTRGDEPRRVAFNVAMSGCVPHTRGDEPWYPDGLTKEKGIGVKSLILTFGLVVYLGSSVTYYAA